MEGATARVRYPAPGFKCKALDNGLFADITLEQYKGKWVVLFFYPLDFTFVCPTEICEFSDKAADFTANNCQVLGASCDSHFTHFEWTQKPRAKGGIGPMSMPLLADIS